VLQCAVADGAYLPPSRHKYKTVHLGVNDLVACLVVEEFR